MLGRRGVLVRCHDGIMAVSTSDPKPADERQGAPIERVRGRLPCRTMDVRLDGKVALVTGASKWHRQGDRRPVRRVGGEGDAVVAQAGGARRGGRRDVGGDRRDGRQRRRHRRRRSGGAGHARAIRRPRHPRQQRRHQPVLRLGDGRRSRPVRQDVRGEPPRAAVLDPGRLSPRAEGATGRGDQHRLGRGLPGRAGSRRLQPHQGRPRPPDPPAGGRDGSEPRRRDRAGPREDRLRQVPRRELRRDAGQEPAARSARRTRRHRRPGHVPGQRRGMLDHGRDVHHRRGRRRPRGGQLGDMRTQSAGLPHAGASVADLMAVGAAWGLRPWRPRWPCS